MTPSSPKPQTERPSEAEAADTDPPGNLRHYPEDFAVTVGGKKYRPHALADGPAGDREEDSAAE